MKNPGIIWLDSPECLEYSLVGTKAGNLARLINAGFSVPSGFCITTQALRSLGAQEKITGRLREGILLAYRRLSEKAGKDARVAVRSSSLFEDLPGFSYAGQYETFLDVDSPEKLVLAVEKCCDSAFSRKVSAYQSRSGSGDAANPIAVVVQVMVRADYAGVIFTGDPLTRDDTEMVVEFTAGSGEVVVSASRTASRLKVSKRELKMMRFEHLEAQVNESDVRGLDWSGFFQMCLRIEKLFKTPQDIEWAYAGGKFWFLQSRPVNFNKTPAGREIWTRANAGEILPGVVTPLTWSVFKPVLAMAGRFIGKSMLTLHWKWSHPYGKFPDSPRLFKGRAYMELTSVYLGFGSLPGITPEILQRILGFEYNLCMLHEIPKKSPRWHVIDIYRKFSFWREILGFSDIIGKKAEKYYKQTGSRWRVKDSYSICDGADLLRRAGIISQEAARILGLHIQCTSMAFSALGLLEDLIKKHAGSDELNVFEAGLIADFNNISTVRQSLAIWDMAMVARQNPGVCRLFLDERLKDGLLKELRNVPRGEDFINRWESFIREFGQRSTQEFELSVPHWDEDQSFVVQTIKELINEPVRDPKEKLLERQEHSLKNIKKVSDMIKIKGGKIDLFRFLRLVKTYKKYVLLRENLKYCVVEKFNDLRKIFLAAGDILEEMGIISERKDIFYLEYAQIADLLKREEKEGIDTKVLIAHKKNEFAGYAGTACADVIFCVNGEQIPVELPRGNDQDVLQGTGCSFGRITGTAYVLDSVLDNINVPQGHILVAPSIDPGLTPLFLTASGLVTEIGGLLSHGATVAREYGLPAVVGVANVTRIIKNGQRITVDGGTGKIYLLPKNEEKDRADG